MKIDSIHGLSWFGVMLAMACVEGELKAAPERDDGAAEKAFARGLPFRQVAPDVFELGGVRLNKQDRSVSFPARINQRDGIIEYAVVTAAGKTHESIFATDVAPEHIHMAMLLLGARPAQTNVFPDDLSQPVPGDRVAIDVRWETEGAESVRPIEDFVVTTNNQETLRRGPWAYNGSHIWQGTFVAQRDGSIISLQIDPDALINSPRPERANDDLHRVNTAALPEGDVPVRVVIRLGPASSPKLPTRAGEP